MEDHGRYDFVLQEMGIEAYVKTLGLLQSHTSYFLNRDVCNFVLMKIHNLRIETQMPPML
jgi:hypothetical protein